MNARIKLETSTNIPFSLTPILAYSLRNPQKKYTLTGHLDKVYSVCMSANGRYLVTCSADKTVRIWNMLRNSKEAVLTGHTGWVYSLCMSRDERFIISGSSDSTVRIWSVINKTQEAVLTGHKIVYFQSV